MENKNTHEDASCKDCLEWRAVVDALGKVCMLAEDKIHKEHPFSIELSNRIEDYERCPGVDVMSLVIRADTSLDVLSGFDILELAWDNAKDSNELEYVIDSADTMLEYAKLNKSEVPFRIIQKWNERRKRG